LCREHTKQVGTIFVKDLVNLGRDLSKTIIIDNLSENFQLQQENGIVIKSWISDPNDTELDKLLVLLKEIGEKKVEDVRIVLKEWKLQNNNNS